MMKFTPVGTAHSPFTTPGAPPFQSTISQAEGTIEKPLIDGEDSHGIFACRHFNRPNPIGISYVALDRVDKGVLHVTGLDLLEGTPVLDIKPYVPAFDSIPDAITGWVSARHIETIRETSINARVNDTRTPRSH